ncbi:uncharacterized protein DS421_18g624490 [Arachis hypogaea]|nr:uncharacterized protein DS421_18g624490 [Arachis hypogaea]
MHSHSTLSVIGASSYPLRCYPLRASSSLRPRSLHHRSFFHRRRSLHRSVHVLITDSNGHSLIISIHRFRYGFAWLSIFEFFSFEIIVPCSGSAAIRIFSEGLTLQCSWLNSAVKNAIPYYSTRKKPSTLKNERENMKDQLDLRYSSKNQSEVEVETELGILDESINTVEIDPISKIQSSLDSSLAKATKTNNIHEGQLNRSQGHANGSIKSMGEGELVTKENLNDVSSAMNHWLKSLFHNLRKEVNGLRIGLEMRIAQLESEKSSLLQKEVGLMEETKRLLSEKEILSLKVENLLGKINLLESDLSFFVENEALAALVLKTGVTIQ